MSQKATASKTTDSKSSNPAVSAGRTEVHSQVSPQEQFLQLHEQFGNRAVQRMHESGVLQAKLKIGQPGDKYEHEADRVAERVMSMPEPDISRQEDEEEVQGKPVADQITPLVQRQSEEEEEIKKQPEEEEEPVQTKLLQRQPEDGALRTYHTVRNKGQGRDVTHPPARQGRPDGGSGRQTR